MLALWPCTVSVSMTFLEKKNKQTKRPHNTRKLSGCQARWHPMSACCGIGHAYVQSANVFIDKVTQGVLLDQPVGPRVC